MTIRRGTVEGMTDQPAAGSKTAPITSPRPPIALVLTGDDYTHGGVDTLYRFAKDYAAGTTDGKVYAFSFRNPEARLHVVSLVDPPTSAADAAMTTHRIHFDNKAVPPLTLIVPTQITLDGKAIEEIAMIASANLSAPTEGSGQ